MTTTTATATASSASTKQKVGLVICGLYCLSNIPSAFIPVDSGASDGPPLAILVVDSVLALLGVVATVLAWRGNRVALRIAAGAMVVITLTGLPAFFVDVPMGVKALVGLSVVVTVVAIVLMFSGARRSAPILD
jgi:hypothetical protein